MLRSNPRRIRSPSCTTVYNPLITTIGSYGLALASLSEHLLPCRLPLGHLLVTVFRKSHLVLCNRNPTQAVSTLVTWIEPSLPGSSNQDFPSDYHVCFRAESCRLGSHVAWFWKICLHLVSTENRAHVRTRIPRRLDGRDPHKSSSWNLIKGSVIVIVPRTGILYPTAATRSTGSRPVKTRVCPACMLQGAQGGRNTWVRLPQSSHGPWRRSLRLG